MNQTVYYGRVAGYGLVFVRKGDACRLARIHRAIAVSRTWCELADRVSPEVMAELLDDGVRISFLEFCKGWLYQSLAWPDDVAREIPSAKRGMLGC